MRDLYLSKRPGSSEKKCTILSKLPLPHTLIYNLFTRLLVSATAAEDYAKYVVSQTIRASPPLWIWRGSYAFTTWIAVGALLLAIPSFVLTELVDIELYADWIRGTSEGNGLFINQCHLLKLAKQVMMMMMMMMYSSL